MKRIIIYNMLAAFMLFAASCRKSDNPRIPTLERVPLPLVTLDAAGDQTISVVTAPAFKTTVIVDMFFKNDIPPQKMDLVVRKNGDNTNVKVLKAGITAYPTRIDITGAQLISLFGTILLNDAYDFGINITTQNGKLYEAFPVVGVGYGSGVAGEYSLDPALNGGNGAQVQVTIKAVCKFTASDFAGNFIVTKDQWADPNLGQGVNFGVGAIVPITVVDATHLSFKSPVNGTSVVVLTVNAITNNITYTGQPYGDYTVGPLIVDPTWPFGPITVENVGTNNFISPCSLTINLGIRFRVAAGSFSNGGAGYFLNFRKQ